MSKLPFKLVKTGHFQNLLHNYASLSTQVEQAALFIQEIEKGNLDAELSIEDDLEVKGVQVLSESLISLQEQMIKVSKEEKQRRWVNEHRSKFIDILRSRNVSLNELGDDIIGNLVKYLGANQGALYVLNEDNEQDPFIEMLACYAYNRKKYEGIRIEVGEGLVGQTILERETTYLSEIPDNYLRITSGLGEANPKFLLIVPLKLDDRVFGALEIASFHAYAPYQIEFTEQLGESIASTISNTKNNQRTRRLLEETQQQTEELRAQEEEARQNMEELQATQEEMQRKSIEIESRMRAIDESGIASIEFDLTGHILTANKNFLKLMGYTLDQIRGQHHRIFVAPEYGATEEYRQFWESLGRGEVQMGEYERRTQSGKRVFIQGSYSILKDNTGRPKSVLKLAADITRTKESQAEISEKANEIMGRLAALDESGMASIEFDLTGHIITANANFCKLMGYALDEIRGKHHRMFVSDEYASSEAYGQFWEDLGNGVVQMGEYERYARDGKSVFIQGSYSVLKDTSGQPTSILKIAADITTTVVTKQKLEDQAKEMEEQEKLMRENIEEIFAAQEEERQAYQKLKEKTALTSAVFNTAADKLVVFNNDLELLDFNPAFSTSVKMSGRECAVGHSLSSVIGESEAESRKPHIMKALTGEMAEVLEQGAGVYLTTYYPVKDDSGQVLGCVINMKDLSAIEKHLSV